LGSAVEAMGEGRAVRAIVNLQLLTQAIARYEHASLLCDSMLELSDQSDRMADVAQSDFE
jgi:hypothetical protein